MEQEQATSRKRLWILLALIIFLVIALFIFISLRKDGSLENTLGGVLPFGEGSLVDSQRPIEGIEPDGSSGVSGGSGKESLFKKLVDVPVAGIYPWVFEGDDYIRYIEKETGHTYDVRIKDGAKRQLTNTTIPRVYEAQWAFSGNAVVLRYLEENPYTSVDIIKTDLAYLNLPGASSTAAIGSLIIDHLPDNVSAISVAPNGKNMFYLLPVADGTSGSIIDLATKITKEVFRSPFGEWLPQLLDNNDVILATKPSGKVPGFSYYYRTADRTLARQVREKLGLTTLPNPLGTRMLFGENVSDNAVLGVYDQKGFVLDEGFVAHESTLPLTTLPEKCAWRPDGIRLFCAAFSIKAQGLIPDSWYQGTLSFNDTFWAVDTESGEIVFLVDPQKEGRQDFDVVNPVISISEHYMVFVNKKDDTVWALNIPEGVGGETPPPAIPDDLTPEEMKDAIGSIPGNP